MKNARMKPPADLSAESKSLWRNIVPSQISASRAALLAEGLRCLDRLRQVQAELAGGELTTVTPRTGAIHVNPLLKIEAELRRQFASVWGQLQLQWRGDIDGMAGIPRGLLGESGDDDEDDA